MATLPQTLREYLKQIDKDQDLAETANHLWKISSPIHERHREKWGQKWGHPLTEVGPEGGQVGSSLHLTFEMKGR